MALSQCAALMEDVPHRCARSGLGPLGRERLQGGTEARYLQGRPAWGTHRRTRRCARSLRTYSDKVTNGGGLKNYQHLFGLIPEAPLYIFVFLFNLICVFMVIYMLITFHLWLKVFFSYILRNILHTQQVDAVKFSRVSTGLRLSPPCNPEPGGIKLVRKAPKQQHILLVAAVPDVHPC